MSLTACLLANDFQVLSRGLEMLAWHGAEKNGANLTAISGALFSGDFEGAETEVMKMEKLAKGDGEGENDDDDVRGGEVAGGGRKPKSNKKKNKKKGKGSGNSVGPVLRSLVAGTTRGTAVDRYKRAVSAIRATPSCATPNILAFAAVVSLQHSDPSAASECLERLSKVDPSLVLRHAPTTSPNRSSRFFASTASPLETVLPRYLLEKFSSLGLLPEVSLQSITELRKKEER